MERSRLVAAAVSAVVVAGITAGGIDWHARNVAAQDAAARTVAVQKQAAQQAQDRADAAEAAVQQRKIQALADAQKRVEAGQAARYTAQEREGLRPKAERVHVVGTPPSVAYADSGNSAANNDPDAQIMPDDADYSTPQQPAEDDDPNTPKTPEQTVHANPYFDSAKQYSITEANAAEGRQ